MSGKHVLEYGKHIYDWMRGLVKMSTWVTWAPLTFQEISAMNSDANANSQNPRGLAESEVAKMKAIAILYHSRGREKEAAAIFELIDKLSKPSDLNSETA